MLTSCQCNSGFRDTAVATRTRSEKTRLRSNVWECPAGQFPKAFSSWPGSCLVNETSAALWAIVELNLWVIVASIPTLRPLIIKTLRDRRERNTAPHLKPQEYNSRSTRSLKARLWPSRYNSSTQPDAVTADSSPSVPEYNVQVSTPNPRERGWSPLGVGGNGKDQVQLKEFDGIRVDREVDVSLPWKRSWMTHCGHGRFLSIHHPVQAFYRSTVLPRSTCTEATTRNGRWRFFSWE